MSKTGAAILEGRWPDVPTCPLCGASCRESEVEVACIVCGWERLKSEDPGVQDGE